MDYQEQLLTQMLDKHQSSQQTPGATAVKVYQNNYIETGINAMSISFPSVHAFLDNADFRKLCKAYLSAYPKTCFDWADYGEHFAEFMFDIEALESLPFLPELAELDWRSMHIERAKNSPFLPESFQLMQSHDIEQLIFIPAPGLQTMQVLFPVLELKEMMSEHQLVQDHSTAEDFENAEATVDFAEKIHPEKINKMINSAINSPVYRSIVLWREEYKALNEYCDELSTQAFESLIQQRSISEVLSCFGDDQHAMMNWLQSQIQTKKIFAIKTT